MRKPGTYRFLSKQFQIEKMMHDYSLARLIRLYTRVNICTHRFFSADKIDRFSLWK